MPKIKKKQYKIRIAAKDIKLGERSQARTCPIARVIRRIPIFSDAEVDGDDITHIKIPFRMDLPPLNGTIIDGVARAHLSDELKNILADVDDVEIVDGEIRGTRNTATIALPKKAQRFVTCFDEGKPVKPFEFTVVI